MDKYFCKKIVLLTILVYICVIFGFVRENTFATTSSLTIDVNSAISLSLQGGRNGALVGSTSTSDNTIAVQTTNATGYTLKIAASSGTAGTPAALNNANAGCSTNCTIPSITTSTLTDVNGFTASAWGYFPSKFNSSTNSYYRPAPTTAGDILDVTNAANSTSNNYNISIGAKVDYVTVSPGSYSNTFVITAVANATPYTITYNANAGGSTVTNMPSPTTVSSSTYDENVAIDSSTPLRYGYNFDGWCTAQTTDGQTCSAAGGTSYAPSANWTIDQTANSNSLTLYAVWEVSVIYMQNLTLANCQVGVGEGSNPANVGDEFTAYDRRDGSDYTVRYINGQCWMTQNLRITGNISSTYSNFTGNDFDVSAYDLATDGANECASSGGGFSHACYHEPDQTDIASIGYGATADSLGVWYNFCAATAGTICSGGSRTNDAEYDICPSGWHLPTGPSTTADKDLNILVGNNTSGFQVATSGLTAFNAVRGGDYKDGKLEAVANARWWAASPNNGWDRITLFYDAGNGKFCGNYSYNRPYGFFIRCVKSQ